MLSVLLAPGQPFEFLYIVTNASGVPVASDSLPVPVLYRNGAATVDGVLSVLSVATGIYRITGTIPETYEEQDTFAVVVNYEVSASARAGIVVQGVVSLAVSNLTQGIPEGPVTVVPGPSSLPAICRVYGRVLTAGNRPVDGAEISILLVPEESYASTTGYCINRSAITVETNADGRIVDKDGNFYVDLVKTDQFLQTEVGWKYKFTSDALGLDIETTLTDNLFDLSTIVAQ